MKKTIQKKKRFTTPEQIKFTKKISVKSLPKTTSPIVKPTEELSIEKEEALTKLFQKENRYLIKNKLGFYFIFFY